MGVIFQMEEGWHVCWKNPGDAGLATTVTFTPPEGAKPGNLGWPRPITFEQPGGIKGYGYAGEVMLISAIVPPDGIEAGARLNVTAEVG